METYTGATAYVVGKWNGNVWVGTEVFTDYAAARAAVVVAGVKFSLERFRELAGDDVVPQRYWIERGIR